MTDTQKQTVLRLLREAGPAGVEVHDLVYQHGITRAAAIVWELTHLDDLGGPFDIETEYGRRTRDGRRRLARYVLKGVPAQPRRIPTVEYHEWQMDVPTPTEPIGFDCGCVRSADAKTWEVRCAAHA